MQGRSEQGGGTFKLNDTKTCCPGAKHTSKLQKKRGKIESRSDDSVQNWQDARQRFWAERQAKPSRHLGDVPSAQEKEEDLVG